MEPKGLVLVEKIVKLFRTAINTYKIYPPGSTLIAKAINVFYSSLTDYLQSNDSLVLHKSHDTIFVEKESLKSSPDIVPLFNQFSFESISFQKNLTLEELNSFIAVINARKDSSDAEEKNLEEALKTAQVKNIMLNEVKYIAVKEGDQIVKSISMLVENLRGDAASMITSLREIYDELDVVQDTRTKREITETLAKKLSTLDPGQLKEFFDQGMPSKIAQSGLKEAVISMMPEEKIKDIFNDISVWYEDIKKNASSDFEAAEKLGDLSSFLSKILTAPQAKNIPFRFYEELLRVGVLEEIPSWIKKEEPSLIFKVDELLEKSSANLLDPLVRDGIPELVRQLCQAELLDVADKLTNKMMENMKQTSLKARYDTIKTLIQIYDVFVIFQKEINIKKLEHIFINAFEKEKDLGIYRELMDMFRKHIVRLLLNNRYEESINVLSLFKRHMYPSTDLDKERRGLTNEYMVKLSGDIGEMLISEIKSGNEENNKQAFRIVAIMEDTMAGVLSKLIRDSEDYKTRKACAFALKHIGEKAVKYFVENLDLSVSTDSMRRIMTILDDFTGIDILDALKNILNYPDAQVKRSAIRYLQKLDNKEVKNILIEKLTDKDITLEIIKALAKLKAGEAVDELIKLAGSKDIAIQEEACIALGKIGDPKSMEALLKLLKVKSSFFGFGGETTQDSIRIRAAWALGNLRLNNKELESKLIEFLKDKNEPVRSEINKSIAKIRERL